MKLFTAPIEERDRSLKNLLQKGKLEPYFKLRYIFGVIGISYLGSDADKDPIVKNDPNLQDTDFTPLWILHIVLMDERILDNFKDAPERSEVIMKAITKAQQEIAASLDYDQKGFIFKLIYRILNVIKMSQKTRTLENALHESYQKLDELKHIM